MAKYIYDPSTSLMAHVDGLELIDVPDDMEDIESFAYEASSDGRFLALSEVILRSHFVNEFMP